MLSSDFRICAEITRLKSLSKNSKEIRMGHSTFFLPDSSVPVVESLIPNIDSIIDCGAIKKNHGGTTASVSDFSGKKFFLKRTDHRAKRFYHRFKYLVFPSRGYLNWVASTILQEHGMITPKILGIGEYRQFGLMTKSYLFAEAMENVVRCNDFFLQKKLTSEQVKEHLVALGQFIAEMHRCGVYHGDCNLANLFFQDDKLGTWDLDGIKIFEKIPAKFALRDLGRAYSSFLMCIDQNPYLDNWISSVKEGADIICQAYGVSSTPIMTDLRQYWFRKDKLSKFIL